MRNNVDYCRTVAKFSMRLVPDQTARDTRIHVENHIRKMWSQYKSVNNLELRMDTAIDPWREDLTSSHYVAAASAMKLVTFRFLSVIEEKLYPRRKIAYSLFNNYIVFR